MAAWNPRDLSMMNAEIVIKDKPEDQVISSAEVMKLHTSGTIEKTEEVVVT